MFTAQEGQGVPNAKLNQGTERMRVTVFIVEFSSINCLSENWCINSLRALAAGGRVSAPTVLSSAE